MVDQTVLSSKGKAKEALIGTIAASGMADNDPNPKWQAFVKAYQAARENRLLQKRFRQPLAARHQLLQLGGRDV